MIYAYKDGTGFQQFPAPNSSIKPYLEATGTTEQRILAGDPYRITPDGKTIEFRDPTEVEAEAEAKALADERAAMNVSRFQARAALLQSNLLDAASAAIAQADALSQLAWEDAQEFRRNSPLIASIASALGLTDEQLDDLFRLAKTIEA